MSEGSPVRVSIVVPAFNEADRIADTLRSLHSLNLAEEIICVDDGSSDQTATIAAGVDGIRVIRQGSNQGKGAALNRGWSECHGDVLLMVDADLGSTAGAAAALLPPVLQGEADMTIAAFPPSQRGGMGVVMRVSRLLVFRATGRWFPAPLSGQRAIRRWVLERIGEPRGGPPFEDRYAVETALNIDAVKVGARIVEVPLPMTHRELGKTAAGWKHRARQLRDILWAMHSRM